MIRSHPQELIIVHFISSSTGSNRYRIERIIITVAIIIVTTTATTTTTIRKRKIKI